MALNWALTKVKDKDWVCFNDGEMKPKTETLIFITMTVGMGNITEKNYKEFYLRLYMYEKLFGTFYTTTLGPNPYTEEDIKAHIGLSTNANKMTRQQFVKGALMRLEQEIENGY